MRWPREISGKERINFVSKIRISLPAPNGSHLRLVTLLQGEHHVTVPNHNSIKIGTLQGIISDVAVHFNKTKEEIANELF